MDFLKKLLAILALSTLICSCKEKRDESVIIVGTAADNAPYEFMEDGKLIGFDIDLVEAVFKKLNLNKKLEFKDMNFDALLPALKSENIDMAIAGFSPTEERRAKIDFSDIYLSTKIALLFKESKGYKKIEDIKGTNIGVQLGTTWDNFARSTVSKYDTYVKRLSTNLALIYEVRNGNIDSLVLEESQAKKFASKEKNLAYFVVEEEKSDYAIALPKESKLTQEVNRVLKELKEEGVIDALIKKWLDK